MILELDRDCDSTKDIKNDIHCYMFHTTDSYETAKNSATNVVNLSSSTRTTFNMPITLSPLTLHMTPYPKSSQCLHVTLHYITSSLTPTLLRAHRNSHHHPNTPTQAMPYFLSLPHSNNPTPHRTTLPVHHFLSSTATVHKAFISDFGAWGWDCTYFDFETPSEDAPLPAERRELYENYVEDDERYDYKTKLFRIWEREHGRRIIINDETLKSQNRSRSNNPVMEKVGEWVAEWRRTRRWRKGGFGYKEDRRDLEEGNL
jgi:hypothetical protein